ncbi:MAG: helix-turn-helix domain-containing protein [Castellaniella sp.]
MIEEEIHGIHLPSLLQSWADRCEHKQKRVRTRRRLLAASAAVMEQAGYEGLTVDAIVRHARVARGTFYLYFSDRSIAAIEVMRAFAAMMRKHRPRGGARLSAVQSIYRINLFYSLSYSRNSRLLAGRESLMRDCPELVVRRDAINTYWARLVLKDLHRRCDVSMERLRLPQAELAIRAVLSMADEFLREIYVYQSPNLVQLAQNPHEVALVLTQVWHRAVFGQDPDGWDPVQGLPMTGDVCMGSVNSILLAGADG